MADSRRRVSSRSTAWAFASLTPSTPPRSLARSLASRPRASGARSSSALASRGGGDAGRTPSASEEVRRIHAPCREQRAQLPEAPRLDLADTLAGESQTPTNRVERLGRIAIEAEAAAEDQTLVRGEVVEHRHEVRALAQQGADGVARGRTCRRRAGGRGSPPRSGRGAAGRGSGSGGRSGRPGAGWTR